MAVVVRRRRRHGRHGPINGAAARAGALCGDAAVRGSNWIGGPSSLTHPQVDRTTFATHVDHDRAQAALQVYEPVVRVRMLGRVTVRGGFGCRVEVSVRANQYGYTTRGQAGNLRIALLIKFQSILY